MGAVNRLFRMVGLVPGRGAEDVLREGRESKELIRRERTRVSAEARDYILRHGDGMSVEDLGRMLGGGDGDGPGAGN